MYPQTSETFVANEILRHERNGLPMHIYSLRRPTEDVKHDVVRQVKTAVTYMPDPLWKSWRSILNDLRTLRREEPARFRETLGYVRGKFLKHRSFEVWKRFFQAAALGQTMRRDGVEHVHAHFAHSATQVTLIASMLTGVKFSFTGHAKDIYTASRSDLREKLSRASFALTCTGANQRYMRDVAGSELRDKIQLAYHGVDTTKFTPGRRIASSDVPHILSVGRLVKKKGFLDLIQAFATLRDRGVSFRATIVGEGDERKRIEARIEKLNLGEIVSVPGAVSQEALVEIYRSATVFALPCRVLDNGDRDGIPNVLLEAMAVGLPVVSSPISGIPEAVHNNENGLLVGERDVSALASALELLLFDSDLRARLGTAAHETIINDFSADAMADRLANVYFSAVGRERRSESPILPVSKPLEGSVQA